MKKKAAWEGYANFYSASVWNSSAESDCEFMLDGDSYDCGSTDCHFSESNCTGPWTLCGVEFDWLCFWWDIMGAVDLAVSDITDIFIGAEPDGWSSSNVYPCLKQSAIDEGVNGTTWDYWGDLNMVNHFISFP